MSSDLPLGGHHPAGTPSNQDQFMVSAGGRFEQELLNGVQRADPSLLRKPCRGVPGEPPGFLAIQSVLNETF